MALLADVLAMYMVHGHDADALAIPKVLFLSVKFRPFIKDCGDIGITCPNPYLQALGTLWLGGPLFQYSYPSSVSGSLGRAVKLFL